MTLLLVIAITAALWALFFLEREVRPQLLEDRSLLLIFLGMVISLRAMITDHLHVQPPFGALAAAGLVLFVLGVIIRIVARRTLGRFFTYELTVKKEHRLVTHGIYRSIRHPLYTGILLLWFGAALALQSLIGFLLALALLVPALAARIRKEEAFLGAQFGAEYRGYMKRTRRLVPFVF